jgi:anthranilate phosphoribosyltransferase
MVPLPPPPATPNTLAPLSSHWLKEASILDSFLAGALPEEDMLQCMGSLHPANVSPEGYKALYHAVWATRLPDLPTLTLPDTVVDVCGTGGSGLPAGFNTSTTVALLLASLGVPVIKFGNRAFTSVSGSFDFLEDLLGVPMPLPTETWNSLFETHGVFFVMAPQVYPALKVLGPYRKAVAHPTAFNIIGPLLNPYQPARRLIGCSSENALPTLASLLAETGGQGTLLRAATGLDEADAFHPFQAIHVQNNSLTFTRHPALYSTQGTLLEKAIGSKETGGKPTPIPTGSPQENVALFWTLAAGEATHTPLYHHVVLNSALAWQTVYPLIPLPEAVNELQRVLSTSHLKQFTEAYIAKVQGLCHPLPSSRLTEGA